MRPSRPWQRGRPAGLWWLATYYSQFLAKKEARHSYLLAATTGSHNKQLPKDFTEDFAAYWKHDRELYRHAGQLFEAHLDRIPQCRS